MTFREAAEIRWYMILDPVNGVLCEDGCGTPLPEGTVPHHETGRGGIGGKRKHAPENLLFLCAECHRKRHE